jgi:hypothetical protein
MMQLSGAQELRLERSAKENNYSVRATHND